MYLCIFFIPHLSSIFHFILPFIKDPSGYIFLLRILRHIWCQYFPPVCHVCVCVPVCVAAKMSSSWCRRWHTHFANCTHFGAFMWPVGRSRKVCQLPQGRRSKRVCCRRRGKGVYVAYSRTKARKRIINGVRRVRVSLRVRVCIGECVDVFNCAARSAVHWKQASLYLLLSRFGQHYGQFGLLQVRAEPVPACSHLSAACRSRTQKKRK